MNDLIYKAFDEYQLSINDIQCEQLSTYAKLLKIWNNKMNLTAVTDDEGIVYRHFIDSLMVLKYIDIKDDALFVDIGTGAGLPGIPLAIMTGAKAVLFDALGKRIVFLQEVVNELNLNRVKLLHTRAEVIGRDDMYRASFDYAFSRAVTQLPTLVEYSVPLLKVGGKLLAYKSFPIKKEIENSENSMNLLKASVDKEHKYTDKDDNARVLLEIIKNDLTDIKYPRRDGIPNKKPL